MKKLFSIISVLLLGLGSLFIFSSCEDEEILPIRLSVPTNVVNTSATHSSAAFTWNTVEGAQNYMTELADATNELNTQSIIAQGTEVVFNQLEAEHTYSFRVKALGANNSSSEFSEWLTIVTSEEPILAIPQGIIIKDITETSATVQWNQVANATGYSIEFNAVDGETQFATSTVNNVVLSNLTQTTTYSVRVKSIGDNFYIDSDFSAPVEFITAEGEYALKFAGGNGTKDNPYQIATSGQLALLQKYVNEEEAGYESAFYKVTADINLAGRNWIPIGSGDGSNLSTREYRRIFTGDFNGNNHSITNFNCVVENDFNTTIAGLFGIFMGSSEKQIYDVKLEGSVVATGKCSTPSTVVAGGLIGLVPLDGIISGCSFKGSVKSLAENDLLSTTTAGGIVGFSERGLLYYCEVEVGADNAISAEGFTNTAGGMVGYGTAGTIQNSKVTIAGTVESIKKQGTNTEADHSSHAGGIIAYGFGTIVSDCEVTISGDIKAASHFNVNAGGAIGVSQADVNAGITVNLTGDIEAISEAGNVYAGGIIGRNIGGYGIGGLHSTISGNLTAISKATTNKASLVGGVVGHSSMNISNSSATLSGTFTVEGETIMLGGVIGQAGNVDVVHFIFKPSGNINLTGKTVNFGGAVGAAASSNITGSYSIIDGDIDIVATGQITFGGITSAIGVATGSIYRAIKGCYSIIGGNITTESGAIAPYIGGILGANQSRGSVTAPAYWWSESVAQGHGRNVTYSQVVKMAARDEASFRTAMDGMNPLFDAGYGRYEYDSTTGWLKFVK